MAPGAAGRLSSPTLCSNCFGRLARQVQSHSLHRSSIYTKRKLHDGLAPGKQIRKNMLINPQGFVHHYFSANTSIDRGWLQNGFLAAWRTVAEPPKDSLQSRPRVPGKEMFGVEPLKQETMSKQEQGLTRGDQGSGVELRKPKPEAVQPVPPVGPELSPQVLPHRRRRPKRDGDESNSSAPQDTSLPLDASSRLTTAATSLPASAILRRKLATYLSLTKPRLSFLVLLTTTSAYSLYPIPEILSSATSSVNSGTTLSTSTLTLLFLTTGTFLSCACANTLNMLFEPQYDALMTRTRNRPLVRKLLSRRAAALFALLCGSTGLLLLGVGTSPTVAGLSALNIFLYAGVYTPMKRLSAANTWIGAIVGGIPPLMGWCAAAGEAATSEHHSWKDLLFSESSVGGWLLAALLFAWQFPHFMSLSHTIRDDYRNAGHQMLSWTNPARNARVALRYSIAMFPICGGLYWAGIVNPGFLAVSTVCNVWLTREALRFWRKQGAGGSARGLFWASVWQLPLVLVGALACKTGIWDGFFGSRDAVSVYDDEDDPERDGEPLGMDTPAAPSPAKAASGEINLAMLGFKRPS